MKKVEVLVGSHYTLFCVLFYAFILLITCSCTSQNRFNKIAEKHKDWLAEKCKDEFPIDTTTKTNTVYIPANNIDWSNYIDSLEKVAESARNNVKRDTIYSKEECNELLQENNRTINNLSSSLKRLKSEYEKCKPDTVFINTTYTVKDSRELFLAQKDLSKYKALSESRTKQRNTWAIIACIALAVHVVRFLIKR